MFKKKSGKITFVSTVQGLETIEDCKPKPAKNFIPEWFKEIPSTRTDTVRVCPSFPDYFSLGYIMPMWTDTVLRVDQKGPFWSVMQKDYSWDFHGDNQFIDWCYPKLRGTDAQFIFKSESPWKIITPPGWSVLQLPLFYHFDNGFSVLPGILDTDIHHETNHQVMYHGDGKDVVIKAGDPFALYVPFKRSENLNSEVRYQTKEDQYMFKAKHLDLNKHFRPNGAYRALQRKRDKNLENRKQGWPWKTKTQK